MKIKKRQSTGIFAVYIITICILIFAFIFCIFMVRSINKRMNESATSNLLNTTQVIENTLSGFLDRDLESLNIIAELHKEGETLDKGEISALCNALNFDWFALVDDNEEGTNYFSGIFKAADLPCYDQWIPGEKGYSNSYMGQSGRSQIALWLPIYQNGQYIGTAFGGVILEKYYSADIFTFYEGEGRTYLFNAEDGQWILKSLGLDGTPTRHSNIYTLLTASGNKEKSVDSFRQAVEDGKTGTAVFKFNEDQSYLCFMPFESSPGWYVTTVIAKDTLLKESVQVQNTIRLVLMLLCGILVVGVGIFSRWMIQKTKREEENYRQVLFANISANLDSAFLIYEKNNQKTAFVSDNMKRLLGVDREWLTEDTGRLFDWCKIPEEDPQRQAFLEGTMEKSVIREVYVEDELGASTRVIKLELILADMDQELAVLTDITKDKEIQNSLIDAMERAEAASNAKNDFLSAMSHDLRTPINGIVGMTAIAAAHLSEPYRVKDCLTKISESTSHLLSLINEVLDMSQIENGKIQLSNEPFNIAELLQNVLSINYPGIQQKNHKIKVHINIIENEDVIGDPVRLTRVAANLISNAIKYTPSGGEIMLSLQERPGIIQGYGCYELMVQDNGIGMSREFQEKIFEPFEREEDVRLSRIQGTGLGLSIVKNIVDLMLGSISVDSEKGKGSTFRVILNFKLDEQKTNTGEQLAGLPVLIVDDDIVTCTTVSEILCNTGMEAEWTTSGKEAVEMVTVHHQNNTDYMAVILDWKMPGMDGVETARQIRAQVGSEVPIIILTAYEWGEIEETARAAGVDAFLSKPIYKSKLIQKMTEITEGQFDKPEESIATSPKGIPKGKRILLAEDNELNREIAVEFLKMLGVESDCAENGADAVKRFAESMPGYYGAVLMDIQMPKMNGYEAARRIRKMDNRPDGKTVPIVAMTADAFKKDEQAAREAGMNAHLAKPISVDSLAMILVGFLSEPTEIGEVSGNEEI